tara:strand:+ start:606 stop:992 length:387 start_codon:yes stop_codon:yes gene_type:complete
METRVSEESSCASDSHDAHSHSPRAERTLLEGALLFRALGSPERLQLMELLLDQEHCVSQLAQELEEKVTTVSQRLQLLHSARLLSKERRGKHMYYKIADHHVRELLTSTFDHVEEDRLTQGRRGIDR